LGDVLPLQFGCFGLKTHQTVFTERPDGFIFLTELVNEVGSKPLKDLYAVTKTQDL
jgi:hypothetical protein